MTLRRINYDSGFIIIQTGIGLNFLNPPGPGWELSAWIATNSMRQAIDIALCGMISSKEISSSRAKKIATMALRTNAGDLYHLGLQKTK